MNSKTRDKFQAIGERASQDAALVECSKADYREGLGIILGGIECELDAAEDDAKRDEDLARGEA